MNVNIAVPGTFHAFELGEQLHRQDALDRIYTTFPRFMFDPGEVPPGKITPIRHPEAVMQLGNRLPFLESFPTTRWKNALFDRSVSKRLERTEQGIFLGFAGCSLAAVRRANELGMRTIIERSSAHIRTQQEILNAEYESAGVAGEAIDQAAVDKEEKEYAEADHVVVPSSFVYQSFLDRGFPEEKLIQEPLGVEIPSGAPSPVRSEKFTVVFVGRVELRKGIHYLLEAWTSLDLDDAELVVVGPQVSKEGRRLVEEFQTVDSIEFKGYVQDLQRVYWESSAFVLPSIEDGFGRVVLEAMASELPVVVSENTGAKDCVRDQRDGYVVPVRDSEAIADAIRELHADPERRRQMGERARSHVESEFTWDQYGDRIHQRYASILDA